jgi:hypothetical protein
MFVLKHQHPQGAGHHLNSKWIDWSWMANDALGGEFVDLSGRDLSARSSPALELEGR